MHDIVADFQIAKVRKKSLRPRAALLLASDGGRAPLERGFGSFIKQISFDVYNQIGTHASGVVSTGHRHAGGVRTPQFKSAG